MNLRDLRQITKSAIHWYHHPTLSAVYATVSTMNPSFFFSQLIYQVPSLLVCIIAIVFGLIHLGRLPLASILTMCGAVAIAGSGLGVALVQAIMVQSGNVGTISIIGALGTLVRTAGLALIVTAVFVDRSRMTK
jgi:hypothetical protein